MTCSANLRAMYVFPVPLDPQRIIRRWSSSSEMYLCRIVFGTSVSNASESTLLCSAPAATNRCYHNTRSSSMVTLARPPTRSSLKITNRSFQYAALTFGINSPPSRQILSPSGSPPITHGSSSSLSPLSSRLIRSFFHSELKSWFFGKSFPP